MCLDQRHCRRAASAHHQPELPRILEHGWGVPYPSRNLVGEGLSDVIGPEPLFLSLPCCPARINTTTLTIATPAGIVKPSLSIQSQF